MWYEIKVKTTAEAIEGINNIFYNHDVTGIVTEDPNDPIYQDDYKGDWDYFGEEAKRFEYDGVLMKGYVEVLEGVVELMVKIEGEIKGLSEFGLVPGPVDLEYSEVHEDDWANEWKKYYKPFEIAKGIVIKPVWEDYEAKEGEKVIVMDPGKAFGTGTHETTSLCAQKIAKYKGDAKTLYDVGCGSGILAIVGAVMGIPKVCGVDIDELAIENSRENAALNNFDSDITFEKGNLIDLFSEPADIIVANIIADVIILLTEDIHRLMHEKTTFIASGILVEKRAEVETALLSHGFNIVEVEEKGEWCVIVSKRV